MDTYGGSARDRSKPPRRFSEKTMLRNMAVAGLVATLALGWGCIRRAELIAVAPDGAADLLTLIEGEVADVRSGDALPTKEVGWEFREEAKKDHEGRDTLVQTSRLHVPAGEPLPATYAKPGSPLADAALAFPTTVTIEKREDGTYYHFRRTYKARSWAWVGAKQKELLENDEIEVITKKDPADISTEERATVAKALIEFEGHKQLGILEQALEAESKRIPQDFAIKARAAAAQIYQARPLLEKVASKLLVKDEKLDTAELEAELQGKVRQTLVKSLESHGLPKESVEAALAAYDAALLRYRVSEDLGDDVWVVFVCLPGKIIAHDSTHEPVPVNAELEDPDDSPEAKQLLESLLKSDFAPGFQMIQWDFDGKSLYDRDVTLRATSFVPK